MVCKKLLFEAVEREDADEVLRILKEALENRGDILPALSLLEEALGVAAQRQNSALVDGHPEFGLEAEMPDAGTETRLNDLP
jgi:hypothetical protein